jgi:hypothetical protein
LEETIFNNIEVVTVSTRRVVMLIFFDHNVSRCRLALLPWTPTLAIGPPAAIIDLYNSNVVGMPTASIATSTLFSV